MGFGVLGFEHIISSAFFRVLGYWVVASWLSVIQGLGFRIYGKGYIGCMVLHFKMLGFELLVFGIVVGLECSILLKARGAGKQDCRMQSAG